MEKVIFFDQWNIMYFNSEFFQDLIEIHKNRLPLTDSNYYCDVVYYEW